MPIITFTMPEGIDANLQRALRNVFAQIEGIIGKEHNDDGTHSHITALSMNVQPNPARQEETAAVKVYGEDWVTVEITGPNVFYHPVGTARIKVTAVSGTANIFGISPVANAPIVPGEMFLIMNDTTTPFYLIHQDIPDSDAFRLPDGLNYTVRPNECVQLIHDEQWRLISANAARQVPEGLLGIFSGACPDGWTEDTDMRDYVPIGGTVGQVNATLGAASVTPTFNGTAGNTGNAGAHTPAGGIVSTFTGTPVAAHTHTFTTDSGVLTAVVDFDFASGGDGTIWAWNSDVGTNPHTHTGTTDAGGGFTPAGTIVSTFTGTPVADHSHSFTPAGTIPAVDVHQPSRRKVFCYPTP